jgi:tetratricopeptide (TPR) repeat protein
MSTQPSKAKSIFLKALELSSPSERHAFLDAQCGDAEDLRRDVEGLLQHVEQLGSFLEAAPRELPVTSDEPDAAEGHGTVIGPYKLLQAIGEGGMGTVWMAEQTQPVQRKVALKIIKAGMDSRHVLACFEAERQALALMDHPHIAKVLDAGATLEGRPYFVMELVKGQPITQGIKLLEETLALQKAKLGPDHPSTLASMYDLATAHGRIGHYAEEVKFLEQTLPLQRAKLGPDHPSTMRSLNNLAWALPNCTDAKVRDPARAAKLAKEAIQLAPRERAFWNTLGVAHLRAAEWQAARAALEQAMELGNGGNPKDWFPLAMVHWQLSKRDEARKWYERAIEWMEKNQPQDPEVRAFQVETEQMLGVQKKKM